MFGKLKDKLKSALNVFSTKTQEEAQDLPQEEVDKVLEEQKEESKEQVHKAPEKETIQQTKPVKKEVEKPETNVGESKKVIHQESDFSREKKIIRDKNYNPKELIEESVKAVDVLIKHANGEEKKVQEKLPSAHDLISQAKEVYEKKEQERIERQKKKKEVFAEKLVEDSKPKEQPQKQEPRVEVVQEAQELKEEKKKGFFGKLFSRKKEEEKEDVPLEKIERVISGEKEEPVAKKQEAKEQKPLVEKKPIIEEKNPELKEEPSAKPVQKEVVQTPEVKEEPVQEEPKSFFGKIKRSLTTKTISQDKFEELFWDLELVLLENNVSLQVIEKIKDDLKEELVDKPLPRDILSVINETLQKTLREILTHEPVDLIAKSNAKKPLIIAFFGINGAGKTTSIAKLTHYFQKHGKSVVLAACDTFRAAAIQQLEEHAKKLNTKIIKHNYGSDAAAVAFDAVKYAQKNGTDVVLIDTAGRLHSNTNLMQELEKIIRVTKPDLKIFVGESITGNDCVEQATKFNELVQMDGAILTKADVDEKGGAPLSISYVIGKPILFLGVGQTYDDFEEFDVEKMLKRVGF